MRCCQNWPDCLRQVSACCHSTRTCILRSRRSLSPPCHPLTWTVPGPRLPAARRLTSGAASMHLPQTRSCGMSPTGVFRRASAPSLFYGRNACCVSCCGELRVRQAAFRFTWWPPHLCHLMSSKSERTKGEASNFVNFNRGL